MKIEDARNYVLEFTQSHQELFLNTEIDFSFSKNKPLISDWSDEKNPGVLQGNFRNKSGVYFFTKEDNHIIYIGKATNDIHQRVWDHIKTSIDMNGRKEFPNTSFVDCPESPGLVKEVSLGNVRLYAFTLSDPDLVSLIEVYLQIQFKKLNNGKLPAFNKRIG